MKIKVKYLNKLIFILLFPILIIDMINGFILEEEIFLSVSIGQLYKLILMGLMFFRLITNYKSLILVGGLFLILLSGTFFRIFSNELSFAIFLDDVIKILKYLMPPIAFLYFREIMYLNNSELLNKYIIWIKYSYFILAVNLAVKLIGLGYPMYKYGMKNIGTKGFFYAGNEISALLIVLFAILGYYYWEIEKNKIKFVFYLIVSFVLGLLISSKTGIMGIILIFILIIFDTKKNNFNFLKLKTHTFLALALLPIFVWLAYKYIINSSLMIRFTYFWSRMDLLTFIMSSRNFYFEKMISIYNEKYSWIEKLIGGGQNYYQELLGRIIEIDPIDIFFAYGYVGSVIFLGLIIILLIYAKILVNRKVYPYARLSYFMIIVLSLLSCLSGHIFNSGVLGIFIGFLFSLMFFKNRNYEKKAITN